ncbi:PilZ domain-containing protein [Vibrio mangrovi]|uniref:PilZ domain protein n=1 Tax=Vibrio mangrovi TaxID=474394 RepID=A0A1Y6IRK2_9VIBR|nr:PilZ domain-containing protein [Vibrio mangrovi]MDW6001689.1 PilZ domain-containing protein [Vibrio mangrovi]SMS00284.1 PilZ domain protein [Vibrio mangrovi]
MQKTEIRSIAEKLIPAYNSDDFEKILSQMTEGQPPSAKLLVKMELNRVMSPCTKTVDLRGRVQGECREYILDGLHHWLDDVAFNDYYKHVKKFGGYTEGVWEALYNTRNNFRVMKERNITKQPNITDSGSPFEVETINLGYDLKRRENRLKITSQVEITLSGGQPVASITLDISPSGAKVKVPAAFDYKLGETIHIRFTELEQKHTHLEDLQQPIKYRILGVDESLDNDSVKFLRLRKLTETQVIDQVIQEHLFNETQKIRHDNQDKIMRARTRAYEHTFLKHACQLPVFFQGNELKVVLLTESNHDIWHYWHDERNQQSLGNLFNPHRMEILAKPGVSESSNTLYTFKHDYQDKSLFFSMMKSEGTPEQRKLFWHIGAKKASWRAFRISMFELSDQERESLATESPELTKHLSSLTHCGILQEISNPETAHDYLLVDKPKMPSSELNIFRHPRKVSGYPISIFFDARTQRKEPRYRLNSPIKIQLAQQDVPISGKTLDLSRRGVSITLDTPVVLKVGDLVNIDYLELKLYNKKLPLDHVPYQVARITPNGQVVQLAIQEDSHTVKIIRFFSRLIESNRDKLIESNEVLPTLELLEGLHHILLDKVVCAPIFVERQGAYLKTSAIGVKTPLEPYLILLAKLGHEEGYMSLDPFFKGHSNTLIAQPMKHVDGAGPQYFDIYLSVRKFGNRIQSIETRLLSDFTTVKERISFIQDSLVMGDIYVLRYCAIPVFHPLATLLRSDLDELSLISLHHAKSIEKSIASIVGYGEFFDITEEVLIRLEINSP